MNTRMKFPMRFEVKASATSGMSSQWKGQAEGLSPIPCAIPPEFCGPGGGYSPEDLFALSLLNCLIATYKVYCEKTKIYFDTVDGKISLTVDKPAGNSGLAMTQADIYISVQGASDIEKARKLLDDAIRDCAVSNSIKSGKTFHITVA
jgi:organic hydroperoxide reductase OsmC/OhrA